MVSVSGIGGQLYQWIIQPIFWLVILIIILIGFYFILRIRKRRTLIYKCIELVDLNGKAGFNNLRCGWFGRKSYLKGLLWSGPEVLKTKTGEEIMYFSDEDFQEIDGERGVVCYRDPLNRKILVPISHVGFANKKFVGEIAPASYRDAAADIFNETVKETSTKMEKIMQFAGWALVVMVSLILIIVIVQYVKSAQKDAADLIITAGTKGAEVCKDICKQAVSTALQASTAP
jgi:uncharacterized membrane protein